MKLLETPAILRISFQALTRMIKILKKFDEKIKFRTLLFYWIIFFIVGISLMNLITPLSPSFEESSKEISERACTKFNMILTIFAPITETFIFMIIPYKLWKTKGLSIGITLWILLHLLTLNFPTAVYILIIGIFYYRCIEIRRYREVILFHFIPNTLGIISCIISFGIFSF